MTATSDNTGLILDPAVSYTSANPTGTLSFTPLADQSGTASITVTVEDAGLDNDMATTGDNATVSRTFDVIVNPINDEPTLDSINNLTIDEDAAEQTVAIAGISAGPNESQGLRVTAISSDPPTGSFSKYDAFEVGSVPQNTVVRDFNGDGIQDLAVTNNDDHNVSILL